MRGARHLGGMHMLKNDINASERVEPNSYCVCEVVEQPQSRVWTRKASATCDPQWQHEATLACMEGNQLKFTVRDFAKNGRPLGWALLTWMQVALGFDGELLLQSSQMDVEGFLRVKVHFHEELRAGSLVVLQGRFGRVLADIEPRHAHVDLEYLDGSEQASALREEVQAAIITGGTVLRTRVEALVLACANSSEEPRRLGINENVIAHGPPVLADKSLNLPSGTWVLPVKGGGAISLSLLTLDQLNTANTNKADIVNPDLGIEVTGGTPIQGIDGPTQPQSQPRPKPPTRHTPHPRPPTTNHSQLQPQTTTHNHTHNQDHDAKELGSRTEETHEEKSAQVGEFETLSDEDEDQELQKPRGPRRRHVNSERRPRRQGLGKRVVFAGISIDAEVEPASCPVREQEVGGQGWAARKVQSWWRKARSATGAALASSTTNDAASNGPALQHDGSCREAAAAQSLAQLAPSCSPQVSCRGSQRSSLGTSSMAAPPSDGKYLLDPISFGMTPVSVPPLTLPLQRSLPQASGLPLWCFRCCTSGEQAARMSPHKQTNHHLPVRKV